jgi:hypothetical protein
MSSNPILPKVFITKYALTTGITVVAGVEHCTSISERMISYQPKGSMRICVHKPDWHETQAEAKARFEAMRKAKLAALKKQIAKLEALDFDKLLADAEVSTSRDVSCAANG